jgi:hypothetical protein
MLDTTPVTTAITRLISTGTTEEALLTAVAYLFPNLSPAELSQALQVATTAAERQAMRRH